MTGVELVWCSTRMEQSAASDIIRRGRVVTAISLDTSRATSKNSKRRRRKARRTVRYRFARMHNAIEAISPEYMDKLCCAVDKTILIRQHEAQLIHPLRVVPFVRATTCSNQRQKIPQRRS